MMLPPIIQKPCPNFWRGPSGYPTRAIVNHRIVGSLESARARFMNPNSNASSHFGIGYDESNRLVIEQYVALDDSAWTNGDVREPTWPLLLPGVNPNLYTWTIEHEDGGSANRGVVADAIWQASIELQVILASGDPTRIRAAGIHFRADSVAQDGMAIPRDATGFIDHHQIAGPNKPYCWRPWLDDPGFVKGNPSRRDRLLAALAADLQLPDTALPEDDMPKIIERVVGSNARFKSETPIRREPKFGVPAAFTAAAGATVQPFAKVEGDAYKVSADVTSNEWLAYVDDLEQIDYFPASLGTLEPISAGGVPQAEYDALKAKVAAGLKAARTTVNALK